MASPFDLICEDFSEDLDTIRRLILASQEGGTIDTAVRIASSNAAMLLLAASFEEFIRENLREYVLHIVGRATRFSDVPASLGIAVWQRTVHLLRGSHFGSREFDRSSAMNSLGIMREYCLDEKLTASVSELVAHNENNVKIKELNELFRRAGISDFGGIIGRRNSFVEFFGSANPDKAHSEFVAYLDGYYDSRNEVAHSIGARKISGSTDIERHLDFFGCLSQSIREELNERAAP